MKSEQLVLTWETEYGMPGVDAGNENPLARATDSLFRFGRPFSRLGKCFFVEPGGLLRWLGIFVHSAGDRILFFPGVAALSGHVVAVENQTQRWNQAFQIDHLSLEPDRRSWHFTEPQSRDHLGKLATSKLDACRTFWFSMSVAPENLRLLWQETKVVAETPSRDIERRTEIFRQSREGMTFQLLSLNTLSQSIPSPGFLHFSVVVGPPGFPAGNYPVLGLPHGGPFLPLPPPKANNQIPFRAYRLALSDTVHIEIMVSAQPGHLLKNVVYSCAASGSSDVQF